MIDCSGHGECDGQSSLNASHNQLSKYYKTVFTCPVRFPLVGCQITPSHMIKSQAVLNGWIHPGQIFLLQQCSPYIFKKGTDSKVPIQKSPFLSTAKQKKKKI